MYTQEQVDSRKSNLICWPCGQQFLTDKQKERAGVVTAQEGPCGLCGNVTTITDYRHWNYLQQPKSN